MEKISRDDAADRMFNTAYDQLSAWGRQHVDDVLARMGKIDAPWNQTVNRVDDPVRLRQDNERLSRELDNSRLEVIELWNEMADLKHQLAELQAEFNPST